MTFVRGATLTTATTFGHADTSNLGPTAGNGFYKRWPDDLALLQDLGVTDVRLTFDWARLQPKPGDFDGAWAERFDQMLAAADAIGLDVWATMHDGAEPRWITNEGGFDEPDVSDKWWPRFVERVADRYGESVHGWIPFATIAPGFSTTGWSNTWATLRNPDRPVVAAFDIDDVDRAASSLDRCDIVGAALAHGELVDSDPDDERFAAMRTRLREQIALTTEAAADRPVLVSQFTPHHDDADVAGRIVATLVEAVDDARADGVDLDVVFLDPAIAGPDSPNGLLSAERNAQPAAEAFLAGADSDH